MTVRSVVLALAALAYAQSSAVAQKSVHTGAQKAPELKLRILPDKETYTLHEPLFTRMEFTNLTDKTLCFPEPAQRYEDPVVGSVVVEGGPKGEDRDYFIEHFDGIMPNDEKLLSDMEQAWIKLAPNQVYVTKRSPAIFELDSPGEWQLRGTYSPPVAPFNPEGSERRVRALAAMVGCAPPHLVVIAPVTAIQVMQAALER